MNQHITRHIKLELLGIGSSRDRQLKANILSAANELRLDVTITEVKDIHRLLKYDISGIPALSYQNDVIFQKIVPSVQELKIILQLLLKRNESEWQINRIIVPTDFTEVAKNALHFAVQIAKPLKASIEVVHINQASVVTPVDSGLLPDNQYEIKLDLLQEIEQEYLEAEVNIKTRIVDGFATEELRKISKSPDTDLIVMGTSNSMGFLEKIFGRISVDVASRSSCPIIMVPEKANYKPLQQLIYASNYLQDEFSILPQVLSFSKSFGSELEFLHINETAMASEHVKKTFVKNILSEDQLDLRLINLERKEVTEGLSDYLEEQEADLLMMSTKHRNFLEKLLHKSVTQRMVVHAKVPVMIFHA